MHQKWTLFGLIKQMTMVVSHPEQAGRWVHRFRVQDSCGLGMHIVLVNYCVLFEFTEQPTLESGLLSLSVSNPSIFLSECLLLCSMRTGIWVAWRSV